MQNLNNELTVDPGWNTGWSYWTGNDTPETGVIKLKNLPSFKKEQKLEFMLINFETLIKVKNPKFVTLEGVKKYNSAVGHASLAKGDLFTLAYLIGGYFNICIKHHIGCEIITADKWKGQLSKSAVSERVFKINRELYIYDHITDAVGIGFSKMGLL